MRINSKLPFISDKTDGTVALAIVLAELALQHHPIHPSVGK